MKTDQAQNSPPIGGAGQGGGVRFLIISTGYNCEQFVKKNYASVLAQTYTNWRLIMISDGSDDGTPQVLFDLLPIDRRTDYNANRLRSDLPIESRDGRKVIKTCIGNLGAAFRRWHAIKKYAEAGDVVLLLGMDDELLPSALERIKQEYDAGKWMTYGNWQNQHGIGLPPDFQLEFDEETHRSRNYRRVQYRSTAPNTFRKELFDKIRESDFIQDKNWIMQTTESPVMFACLEMCGKQRIGVIRESIYLYNMRSKGQMAKKRLGRENQERIYNTIINLPKYPLHEERTLAARNE